MQLTKEEATRFARERIESVWITQEDYKFLVTALDHTLNLPWLEGLLFWLDLCDEWPDEMFHQPDGFLELYREQADMQFTGDKYPLPFPRTEAMDAEKLKNLYDHLITAHKIDQRFQKETGSQLTEVVRALGITLFIEEQKASRPRAGGGGSFNRPASPVAPVRCPKCGGEMYDNTNSKKNPKAPDYACKDANCKDPQTGYKTGVWKDRLPVSTPPQQQQAPAQHQPQPTPPPIAHHPAPAQGAPFDDDLPF